MTSDTRSYPFAIPAGGMQVLPVHGEKFQVLSTTGPVDVRWKSGKLSAVLAGRGYNVRKGFDQLTLNNSGALAIVGTIQIADDDLIDNRVTGDVSVIDGEKVRTLSNGRIMGRAVCGPVVAKYPHLQLWNPLATGKNLIVSGLSISAAIVTDVYVAGGNAAFANAAQSGSALIGSVAGWSGEPRSENLNAVEPDNFGSLAVISAQASLMVAVRLSGPIVIPPGYGLTVKSVAQNHYLYANYEWFEEPV